MSELAGFGVSAWLPPRVQRAMVQEDAREALESKRAQAARDERAEAAHERNLTLAAEQAQQRGEELTALALARGEVRGRSVQDVFAAALAASEAADRREAARLYRDGYGEPERLHVEVAEPVLHHAPKSERARLMASRFRRWKEAHDAQRRAEAAKEASRHDWGLVPGVTVRSRSTSVLEARSTRSGGPEVTVGPANIPWSQVAGWLAQGWTP